MVKQSLHTKADFDHISLKRLETFYTQLSTNVVSFRTHEDLHVQIVFIKSTFSTFCDNNRNITDTKLVEKIMLFCRLSGNAKGKKRRE
jgi:hypothetical protein